MDKQARHPVQPRHACIRWLSFDLDAGPVTITLPDAGKRFMSMQVINQDHYVVGKVDYGAGSYTLTMDKIGTRYVADRDPDFGRSQRSQGRRERSTRIQDAVKVSQKAPGTFEVPNWDPASQKKVRDALLVLGFDHAGFQECVRHQADRSIRSGI